MATSDRILVCLLDAQTTIGIFDDHHDDNNNDDDDGRRFHIFPFFFFFLLEFCVVDQRKGRKEGEKDVGMMDCLETGSGVQSRCRVGGFKDGEDVVEFRGEGRIGNVE